MFCLGNVRDRLFLGVSDIVHIARTLLLIVAKRDLSTSAEQWD